MDYGQLIIDTSIRIGNSLVSFPKGKGNYGKCLEVKFGIERSE